MAARVVSVLIPARNAAATLGRTLDCLKAQEGVSGGYEVIVIDNDSSDATAAVAERGGAQVVRLSPQQGPAGGRNAGAARARGSVLAFTDADCFPDRRWLAEGMRCIDQADLVQGRVSPDGSVAMGPFDRSLWKVGEDGLYLTASMFVRRELFDRIRGFEALFHARAEAPFGEDVWFGWRARRAGARSTFCAGACVRHAVFPRSAWGYVAERRRLRHFPALTRRIPELRQELFFAGVFLNPRSAAFDLAAGAALVAAMSRSPAPLWAILPYVALSLSEHRAWGRRAPLVAGVAAAADAAGLIALMQGSVRERTIVL